MPMLSHDSGKPGESRPRRLLLCLDGVPHAVIQSAKERGLFEAFGPPSRLLSPFPTMTNIALAAMMGATPPPGYESLYFDTTAKEIRGGIKKYIGVRTPDKIPSSYMDELDYQEPLAFEFLIYVAPEKIWRADMRRFRDCFREAPQNRDYFAFLKGTDGLLHIRGPQSLAVALESLDKILREIQTFCGNETEIVLFSDHGMNLLENHRAPLKAHLQRQGFTFHSSLINATHKSVAVPAFGLCGYAALYCGKEEATPDLAEALIDLEGLDFSLYRDGETAIIVSGPGGRARVEKKVNGGVRYRYVAIDNDPLQLLPVVAAMRERAEVDEEGFVSDHTWLVQTAEHTYPDAPANLFKSIHSRRVKNTADVLVSFRDGYYYGWSPFARFVRLAATHGNALQPSSNAFLMSTHRTLPQYVRADDAESLLRA